MITSVCVMCFKYRIIIFALADNDSYYYPIFQTHHTLMISPLNGYSLCRLSNMLGNKGKRSSPFWQKKLGRFVCSENIIAIFDLPVTQNEPIFPLWHHQSSTEITKLVLNNNTSLCLRMLFAMNSKVLKKVENFKMNRKGGILKKTP